MAFATTNIRTANLGTLKAYAGDWTGSVGDAAGTITLNGGRVYFARFDNQDADSTKEDVLFDVSASGSTITITVYNHQTVTIGRFFIIFA